MTRLSPDPFPIDDPLRRPLRDIAAAVRARKLDPDDLAARALGAAKAARALNAFTEVAAKPRTRVKGALAGIPYAAKDAIATTGLPTSGASPALAGFRAGEDAEAIRRLNAAGATLIGKANMHELSFGVTSNNAAFGPVRNPYAPDRVAGGSSGGSAVAVAVGAAAFALAADTGGSARIPAALCGLTGFRPTTGRWPDAGLLKVSPTRDTIGAIVRYADDALLIDTVLTGDDTAALVPRASRLKLGLPAEPYFADLDPAVAAVVERFLERLRKAGYELAECDGTPLFELEAESGFPIALHEARIELSALAGQLGTNLDSLAQKIASPDVRAIVSSLVPPGDDETYEIAMKRGRPMLRHAYAGLFDSGLDVLLMPATILPAARIGEDETVMLNGRPVPTFRTYARQTSPASVAGVPSVSIPIGCTEDGLPVGMLAEGRAGTDRRLLAIAGSLTAHGEPVPPPRL